MPTACARFAMITFLLSILAVVPAVSVAASANEHVVVDGVSIYLGIVPAEIVGGHSREHEESEMHGGPPAGKHVYHLVIAVFDQQSGKRISDARVSASVLEINHPGRLHELEPMLIEGTIAYGNYFDLPGTGPYRIMVQIRRPGQPRVIETEFAFRHART